MRDARGLYADKTGLTEFPAESDGAISILVIGDGLPAAVTVGFLEQAGLDPVLATSAETTPRATARTIWEPALALLDRISLREPIERVGTPIRGVRCLTTDRKWTVPDTTVSSLITVAQDQLRPLIERQLGGRITEPEQLVTALEPTDSAVRATFEGTATELFDVVITTTRSNLPGQHRKRSTQTVDIWEFTSPDDRSHSDILTEAWTEDLAAFTVPLSQGRLIRLVADTQTPPNTPLSPQSLLQRFGDLVEGTPFDTLDQRDLRYRRIPLVVPRSLTVDRVALVGRDVSVSVPGDCIGTTLGVEDAWMLADSLVAGAGDIESALAMYATRRRRRRTELLNSALQRSIPANNPPQSTSLLGQIYGKRRLAVEHIVEQSLPVFGQALPDDL